MTKECLIAPLLPSAVRVSETMDERSDPLFPEEEAAIERATPARRAEFRTARACAHDALAALGVPPAPVGRGPRGEPIWPDGVVGSITHCRGYRAAAVARRTDVASIGLDAEPDGPLPHGVLSQVASSREAERLARLPRDCRVDGGRLLFSIKEAVYKAWSPLTGCWLDFEQVDVSIEATGQFLASLDSGAARAREGARSELTGRWVATHGLILTAAVIAP